MTHVEILGIMEYIGVAQKKKVSSHHLGIHVHACAEVQNTFREDIEFVKLEPLPPIVSTSKRPLIFIKNGMV